ncbi:MAG TPA: glycosyltransferase family 4 protein [Chitinophagaceae bacterium]|nr:glycosyltransferase family 4 protein [Chitinophagaceae bacterium]
MKKIAAIIPYVYLPSNTGGQKLIAGFYECLGKKTELYAFSLPQNDASLVTTYSLQPFLKNRRIRYIDTFLFYRVKKFITQNKIEYLIIEHPYMGWLGWLLKKTCGIKLIVHTHNIEYQRFRSIGKWWWRILKLYEGWVLRRADHVFCITREDQEGMIKHLKISPRKSVHIPYGINLENAPTDKIATKESLYKELQINKDTTILFFNGLLSYYPNKKAVDLILNEINPLLLQTNLRYEILIAGKNLPEQYKQLRPWNDKHVRYLGFVDDIDRYTKAADVLLNPVMSGGGVKTKMIEALGLNTAVVSTETGAAGVSREVCGDKLLVVKDNDWKQFTESVLKAASNKNATIPEAFYKQFSWKGIIEKVLKFIE